MQPFSHIFSSPVRAYRSYKNAATSISFDGIEAASWFCLWHHSDTICGFKTIYGIHRRLYKAIDPGMWFALWFPFKILSANHEVVLQCLLRACYCWILLSSFLSSWCFQVQTKLESWTISFCWQFRGGGGLWQKNMSQIWFLGPTQQSQQPWGIWVLNAPKKVTSLGEIIQRIQGYQRFPRVAFRWKPSYATWGGGRFATHSSHLSPRRGDRIWRGSRKGREGQAMQHFHETSTKWNCGTFLFSTCFNL